MENLETFQDIIAFFDGPTAERKELEERIKAALLDPVDAVRKNAQEGLKREYPNFILSAFIGDNQIFARIKEKDRAVTVYVCDLPRDYLGEPAKAHAFTL